MPHYFFHLIYPGCAPIRDDEGLEFDGDDAAKREALASLGEMLSEAARSCPRPLTVSVQIVRAGVGVIDVVSANLNPTIQTSAHL